jgi:hypothetical protein
MVQDQRILRGLKRKPKRLLQRETFSNYNTVNTQHWAAAVADFSLTIALSVTGKKWFLGALLWRESPSFPDYLNIFLFCRPYFQLPLHADKGAIFFTFIFSTLANLNRFFEYTYEVIIQVVLSKPKICRGNVCNFVSTDVDKDSAIYLFSLFAKPKKNIFCTKIGHFFPLR